MWCDAISQLIFISSYRAYTHQKLPNIPNIKTHLNWQLPFFSRLASLLSLTPPYEAMSVCDSACMPFTALTLSHTHINNSKAIVIDTCARYISSIFRMIASPPQHRIQNRRVWERHSYGHQTTISESGTQAAITATDIVFRLRATHIWRARSLVRRTLSVPINLGNLIWHAINTQNKLTGTNNNCENSFYQFLSLRLFAVVRMCMCLFMRSGVCTTINLRMVCRVCVWGWVGSFCEYFVNSNETKNRLFNLFQ